MTTIQHTLTNTYHKIKSFKLTTPSAILIGALLLSLSHIAYAFILSNGSGAGQPSYFVGRPVDANDFMTGNTESDVIVIEYSDTECPFCAQLHPTIQQLQQEYAKEVGFIYRYFPLTQIHPNAFDEARALHCVGKIAGATKRVQYIDDMFNYKLANKNMTLPPNGKEDLAKNLGVDGNALKECLATTEPADIVTASLSDGVQAGVEGTPATFVLAKTSNGYEVVSLISGAQSYEYFKAAIDEALSR